MKIIEITSPAVEYTQDGVVKVYQVENFLRFENEDLIKEKEEEGYTTCLFFDKFDVTPRKTHFLPDENGIYRNEVMWRAVFLK